MLFELFENESNGVLEYSWTDLKRYLTCAFQAIFLYETEQLPSASETFVYRRFLWPVDRYPKSLAIYMVSN